MAHFVRASGVGVLSEPAFVDGVKAPREPLVLPFGEAISRDASDAGTDDRGVHEKQGTSIRIFDRRGRLRRSRKLHRRDLSIRNEHDRAAGIGLRIRARRRGQLQDEREGSWVYRERFRDGESHPAADPMRQRIKT